MEKPTIGSAQTQKSTDKVASKGGQGKTVRETGRNHMTGREEERPGRALPITEISGVSVFVPQVTYTHTGVNSLATSERRHWKWQY